MPKVKKLIKKIKNWHNRKSTKAGRHFTSTKAAQILFDVIREYKPPVYDVFGVQILEHECHLRGVELGLFVVQVPDAPQVVEQLVHALQGSHMPSKGQQVV